MPKRPRAYHRPHSLNEALELLNQPDMAPLAGGTQLLADEKGVDLDGVVDLQALGLGEIQLKEAELQVGATAPLDALASFLKENAPNAAPGHFLQRAIQRAGPNTYRNAATIGGIIAGRLPDSELLAALLTLEARVTRLSPAEVTGSLTDYLAAADRPTGLITVVTIPWTEGWGDSVRVARTPADYPIVSLTAWRPAGGALRLAATGLGSAPQRLSAAERALADGIAAGAIEDAAAAAAQENRHPGDFRGDAGYRAEMAATLMRRLLSTVPEAE